MFHAVYALDRPLDPDEIPFNAYLPDAPEHPYQAVILKRYAKVNNPRGTFGADYGSYIVNREHGAEVHTAQSFYGAYTTDELLEQDAAQLSDETVEEHLVPEDLWGARVAAEEAVRQVTIPENWQALRAFAKDLGVKATGTREQLTVKVKEHLDAT